MTDVCMLDVPANQRDDAEARLSDELLVEVSLLSGRSCRIEISRSATVMELIKEVRKELDMKISRLYYQQQALRRSQPLADLRLSSVQLTAVAGEVQIISSSQAFCDGADPWALAAAKQAKEASFLCILADGRVAVWGGLACSEKFCKELTDPCEVKATVGALAVLRPDGSVCSWGQTSCGADRSSVKEQLKAQVRQIYNTSKAFAALKCDGTVVAWGGPRYENFGGDSSKVQQQLVNVKTIRATQSAFAALKEDGSVVTWGNTVEGGDSSRVCTQLVGGRQLCATQRAFALAKEDGTVVTWGHSDEGGGCFQVADQLHSVVELSATSSAFCALRDEGSVVCWGSAVEGAACFGGLKDVVKVVGNNCAFAAILQDGSVATWGNPEGGGDSTAVAAELKDVAEIRPFFQCFVAIRRDHAAVRWGRGRHEVFKDVADIGINHLGAAVLKLDGSVEWVGDSRYDWVPRWLNENVRTLHVTSGAFAVTKLDGKVVTWGGNAYGGKAEDVQHILEGWDEGWDAWDASGWNDAWNSWYRWQDTDR